MDIKRNTTSLSRLRYILSNIYEDSFSFFKNGDIPEIDDFFSFNPPDDVFDEAVKKLIKGLK